MSLSKQTIIYEEATIVFYKSDCWWCVVSNRIIGDTIQHPIIIFYISNLVVDNCISYRSAYIATLFLETDKDPILH